MKLDSKNTKLGIMLKRKSIKKSYKEIWLFTKDYYH